MPKTSSPVKFPLSDLLRAAGLTGLDIDAIRHRLAFTPTSQRPGTEAKRLRTSNPEMLRKFGAPELVHVGGTDRSGPERKVPSKRTITRWLAEGIDGHRADELACAVGLLPQQVWVDYHERMGYLPEETVLRLVRTCRTTGNPSVAALVNQKVLTAGQVLHGSYKGRKVTARLTEDGRVVYQGETLSLSAAARRVVQETTGSNRPKSGPEFWKADVNGQLVKIAQLVASS